MVQPWMGAWYTLREGDPVAMANREKLKGRRPPTRGRFIVQELDRRRRAKEHAAEPWRAGHFRVGDTLQVEHRPSLSEKVERSVGLCIGRHRRGLGSSFRLLCKPDGVAVEGLAGGGGGRLELSHLEDISETGLRWSGFGEMCLRGGLVQTLRQVPRHTEQMGSRRLSLRLLLGLPRWA